MKKKNKPVAALSLVNIRMLWVNKNGLLFTIYYCILLSKKKMENE